MRPNVRKILFVSENWWEIQSLFWVMSESMLQSWVLDAAYDCEYQNF